MRRLAVVLVVVAALAGVGCSNDDLAAGEASVVIDRGSRVLLGDRGEGLRLAEGRRTVHAGAQVKVLTGSASIGLHDGSRLEVRKGSEIQLGSPVRLVAQDLLVTSGENPVTVSAAGSQVTVTGVAKVSRDLAVSTATYRGSAMFLSAARSLRVPALREATVPSLGLLPGEPDPIDYDPADAWDRRFLGAAIDLGEELEAKSNGFTRSLSPGDGRTPGFYRLLLPELDVELQFGPELLSPDITPGDTLVGATIAVNGRRGSFASRWRSIFTFREKGARWGLVALDQQVGDIQGLVTDVDAAIGRQSFAFARDNQAPSGSGSPSDRTAAPADTRRTPAPGTRPAPAPPGPRGEPGRPTPPPTSPVVTVPPGVPPTVPPRVPPTVPPTVPPGVSPTVPPIVPPTVPPTGDLLTPLVDGVTTTLEGLLTR